MELKSRRHRLGDALEAIELFYQRRWSDGIPVVPPTPERVEEMLASLGRDPQEALGEVPPRYGAATIEKLAINSVMAGCRPEDFPVVVAAIEALLEEPYNLGGTLITLHAGAPLTIVSGPLAEELGMNSGAGVFGNGARANGAIGRAVALALWNLGGSFPGETALSTFGHPGKWSYCIAENAQANPWEPLHVERGLPPQASAVTVFMCEAPHQICCGRGALDTLKIICDAMANAGPNQAYAMGQTLLVLNPTNAQQLAKEGWSKADVRMYLWEKARLPAWRLKSGGLYRTAQSFWPRWVERGKDEEAVPLTRRPEDILIVVAGGVGLYCMFCPGWGDWGGFAVTRPIERAKASPPPSIARPRRAAGIEVLEPLGESRVAIDRDELAPRLDALEGKVVGLLVHGTEVYFQHLEGLLQERYRPAQILSWRQQELPWAPAPEELMGEMASRCQAIIVGICGWGSATWSCVNNAVRLERKGTPTVTITYDLVEPNARSHARVLGLPSLPLVVLPRPDPAEGESAMRGHIDSAFDYIVRALTSSL